MSHICVFEDSQYSQLAPLVHARATFELRCGFFTFIERINRQYPNTPITLFCRDYLAGVMQERYAYRVNDLGASGEVCLFLNGRAILPIPISIEGEEEAGVQDGVVVYVRLKGENIKKVFCDTFLSKDAVVQLKSIVRTVNVKMPMISQFWDIVNRNKSQIQEDFKQFAKDTSSENRFEGVFLMNKENIFVGNNSRIKPCCVLDAENGPIYIGDHVTVSPNTTIEGPVFIGDYSIIQPNSRLRGGTNIGAVCKIGGEVVNTTFHDYSNKQHDGFIGDSCIGSWVNLGANTVNSNLLNTYGSVKVEVGGELVNTQQMFLGMAMGDHTKTAINTTIMTGSIFGFATNIIMFPFPPKYVPSFTWCSNNGMKIYRLDKVLHVAKTVMKRRNKEMTAAEERLFVKIFQLTEQERNFF